MALFVSFLHGLLTAAFLSFLVFLVIFHCWASTLLSICCLSGSHFRFTISSTMKILSIFLFGYKDSWIPDSANPTTNAHKSGCILKKEPSLPSFTISRALASSILGAKLGSCNASSVSLCWLQQSEFLHLSVFFSKVTFCI